MNDTSATFGCRATGLAGLLRAAIDPQRPPADADRLRGDLLRLELASFAGADEPLNGSASRAKTPPDAARPLREVLLDPQNPVERLMAIKTAAKAEGKDAEDEDEQAVAAVVYYAAIAAALKFHGQKITTLPDEALAHAMASLAGKPWMPPELAEHFRAAHRCCGEQKQQPQNVDK